MADNTIQVTIQGKNNLGPAVAQAKSDISGLGSAAQTAKTPLAGLGSVFSGALSGAAILGTVSAVGRLIVQFGALGQSVARSEKYFTAFSGSALKATQNLAAMRAATDGAMSTQEAMNSAASIMGMGLAKNATELQQFARMAVLLGGNTRSATEAINEFQLLIANQSILRLDTFGISGARVRARIEELQAATAGLSREQAFLQSVMEEGTTKVGQLEAAGVKAGTAQDRLRAATSDLKAELAKLVAQPYEVVVEVVTRGIQGTANALGGVGNEKYIARSMDIGSQSYARAENAAQGVIQAQAELDAALISGQATAIAAAEANIRLAQAELDAANAAKAVSQANWEAMLSAGAVDDAERAYKRTMEESVGPAREYAAALDELARAQTGIAATARTAQGFAYRSQAGRDFDEYMRQYKADKRRAEQSVATEAARLAESNAQKAASAYESAMKSAVGRISGYLSQGMQAATSLKDMRGDLFAPGANGPFENLFRALDVANLGGASPWAEKLGLTQEDAKRISEDFQRGIFSPEVMGLVDQGALIKEAQLAAMAEKTREAFATAIAKKAGVGTNLVSAMFGFSGGNTQGAAGAQEGKAAAQVEAAMTQVAGALGNTVQGKDFAGKIIGYGERIWGYFEQGIVDTAKKSSTLQAAIDGMVAAALAKRGGGGVAATARGQGVN